MTEFNVLATALYSMVFITLFLNIVQVLTESSQLKEEGKTPLIGKNITTVVVAALAEVIAVFVFLYVAAILIPNPNVWGIAAVFIAVYSLRNGAAYLAAWGTWTIFVNIEKRKMEKEVKEDMKEEMEEGAL